MTSSCQRQHSRYCYEPLAGKSLHNVLKRELVEEFGFENMGLIADGLIRRFLEILGSFDPKRRFLLPGEVLWLAVSCGSSIKPTSKEVYLVNSTWPCSWA